MAQTAGFVRYVRNSAFRILSPRCVVYGLLGILTAYPGLTAAPQECEPTPVYVGPPIRSAPDRLWTTDFGRSIEGTLDSELEDALSLTLDTIVSRVPAASVAVAIPGKGLWSETRGPAAMQPSTNVVAEQMFQVASITKSFVAATVLLLADEGRLKLDATVDRWFPRLANSEIITVADLLRHTGGVASFNALSSLGEKYRSPAELVDLVTVESPRFCPGTNWEYSNTGYVMLGLIVEDIEGRPLHEVLAKRLFKPLSLQHTALRRPGIDVPVVAGHAARKPVSVQDGYATPYAAGALASTAADLVRFWHALLGDQIVSPTTVRSMFLRMTAMSADRQSFYGLGVQMYDVPDGPGLVLGHSGGMVGFTSIVAYVTEDDVYVSVLLNDKSIPAEAGLWAIVRSLRAFRQTH